MRRVLALLALLLAAPAGAVSRNMGAILEIANSNPPAAAAATLSFIGTATTAGSTGSNVSIAVPTGCTTNDLLILACTERQSTDGITQSTFTLQRFGAQANSSSTRIATHVVVGGDGSGYTITNSAGMECAMGCYRSSSGSAPTIGNLGTTSTASSLVVTVNSVTTAVSNSWVVGLAGYNGTGAFLGAQASGTPTFTERADAGNGGGTTTKQAVALVDALIAAAGATGASTFNLSTTSNIWSSDAIEIRP